jgi:hypothetical protein
MKRSRFAELSVGTWFLFRGQRYKKLHTSLAGDSKRSRIIFDRDTQVDIIGLEKPQAAQPGPQIIRTQAAAA